MRRSESLTKVLLAAGAISGGGAFVVGHLAVAGTPPATLGALRYILATGLFGLLLAFSRGAKRIPRGADALRILLPSLAVAGLVAAGFALVVAGLGEDVDGGRHVGCRGHARRGPPRRVETRAEGVHEAAVAALS